MHLRGVCLENRRAAWRSCSIADSASAEPATSGRRSKLSVVSASADPTTSRRSWPPPAGHGAQILTARQHSLYPTSTRSSRHWGVGTLGGGRDLSASDR